MIRGQGNDGIVTGGRVLKQVGLVFFKDSE
jgi:hypothetical protein